MQQQFSNSFADIKRLCIFIKQKQFFHKLPLAVIVARHLDIEHTLEMKQIKLTTLTFGLLLFGCNEDY
jgi:hypothetical protein